MSNQASEAALASERFQRILLSLRIRSLKHDLPTLALISAPTPIDWNFALLCASALTDDESEVAQIAVLRVASGCLADDDTTPEQRLAASALLERDGNNLAVLLAQEKGYVPAEALAQLPIALQLEVVRSRIEHSIRLSEGRTLTVNSFQSEFWERASESTWLSVSSPTSSGKSRILREWFLEKLRSNHRYSAVYLVPTRALVEEVSGAFRRLVGKGTSVFMMPWDRTVHQARNRVLVITQERLHLIQTTDPSFKIDLMFVDEAQGLGGAHRGILLQQVIDRAVQANPAMQLILASPLSANPELLIENRPVPISGDSFASETVTVNQNLLRVERLKPTNNARRSVQLVHGWKAIEIGTVSLESPRTKVFESMASIAFALGKAHGGNLVYANGASDAEKIALELWHLEGAVPLNLDPEVAELQALIKSSVHPDYELIQVLGRGIGFHYGNMPLAIRAEIERLFEEEKLNFLVCTSTLLEGVNLPCKNIFIRGPRKGRGNPMTALDFWNLAGRAGRWGREFQGNVFCIDTSDSKSWPDPPLVRGRFDLVRAVPSGLRNPLDLVDYLDHARDAPGANSDGENLFSYLATRYVGGSELTKELASLEDPVVRARVLDAVRAAVDESSIPPALIPIHAGISPIALQRLLEEFRKSGLPAKSLVLPLPKEPNARDLYQRAYVRLGDTVTSAFGARPTNGGDDKRKWQIAALVVNWMNGMPLKMLIEQRTQSKALRNAIRDVMSDIETVVRFQSAKYLAAYRDVLAVYAAERGEADLGPEFDVTMMLELGVSQANQVALMSLGLSRTATLALTDYIPKGEWSPAEALAWMQATDLDALAVPSALRREMKSLALADSEDPEEVN